jgi:hypothetical protein
METLPPRLDVHDDCDSYRDKPPTVLVARSPRTKRMRKL